MPDSALKNQGQKIDGAFERKFLGLQIVENHIHTRFEIVRAKKEREGESERERERERT